MADAAAPRLVTRRTFLGWWMAVILTSLTAAGVLPILVYLWPAPPKGQKKGPVSITLDKPITQLNDGEAVKFNAPTNPNTAFIMADGGGDNAPGDLAFGGFAVKNAGKVDVLAINCSHLDRKSTRLNSSHSSISYAVFCLKKKKNKKKNINKNIAKKKSCINNHGNLNKYRSC